MNFMFVNPPIRLQDPPYIPPFGVAIMANMLRDAGHNVAIADINAVRGEELQRYRAPDIAPDVIGVSGIISTFNFVRQLIPNLRKTYPNVPIVVGGGGITSAPKVYMDAMAPDIGVLGEGEHTILELVEHYASGAPRLDDIDGIVYATGGTLTFTKPRKLEKNLDSFPLPAFDLLDVNAYIEWPKYQMGKREASIIATRGCPYDCGFCYHVFGRGARYRSVEHVMSELRLLVEDYGVDSLLWADEFWTANKKFVKALCEQMIAEKLNLKWMCYSRVDALDDETVALMKEAGCRCIGFGLESGSQKILNAMHKGTTVQQNKDAWALALRHGLKAGGTLIYGYPGEDEETIQETIAFCKEIGHRGAHFFLAPYPGTRVFEENKDRIIEQFGSLDEFFSRLGDALEFVVNLTEWPDEWLYFRKRSAEYETRAHYAMREVLRERSLRS